MTVQFTCKHYSGDIYEPALHFFCPPSVVNREVIYDLRAAQHHTILMTLKYHIFLPVLFAWKRLKMRYYVGLQCHFRKYSRRFAIYLRAMDLFSWKMAQSCHGIIVGISACWQILSAHFKHCCLQIHNLVVG